MATTRRWRRRDWTDEPLTASLPPTDSRERLHDATVRAALACLLLFQGIVLYGFAAREVAALPPLAHDQAVYLTDTYRIYEHMRAADVGSGLLEAVEHAPPAGLLPVPIAALNSIVFGPGRLSALGLNIAALIGYMATLAVLLARAYGAHAAAIGLGLFLACTTIERQVGGVADFRFSAIELGAWGVLLTITVLPTALRPLRPAVAGILATTAGLLLILCQTASVAYVLPLYALLLVVGLIRTRLVREPARRRELRAAAILRLGAPLAVWAAVMFIASVANVPNEFDHYGRALSAGLIGYLDFRYFSQSLAESHLGSEAMLLAGAVVVVCTAWVLYNKALTRAWSLSGTQLLSLAAAAIVVHAVLSADEANNPVASNLFVPIFVLVPAVVFGATRRALQTAGRTRSSRLVALLAPAVLALGVGAELAGLAAGPSPRPDRSSAREAGRLILTAGDYVEHNLGGSANWSADAHLDYEFAPTAAAYYYEQSGTLLQLRGTSLGQGPADAAPSPDDVLRVAASSDVLILPDNDAPGTTYPADLAVASVLPQLRVYATAQLVALDRFELYGRTVRLYVRPGGRAH
jgi:hypothetical protein